MSSEEPSQRNLIGSYIFPFVSLILKQFGDQSYSEQQQQALASKVTGMIIEIASIPSMLVACQTLDSLHLKTREALQLINQAEAQRSQFVSSSSSSM